MYVTSAVLLKRLTALVIKSLLCNIVWQVMDKYRSGEVRLLVATDVAARGLDVKDIAYVINYDFPVDGVEVRWVEIRQNIFRVCMLLRCYR